MNRVPPPANPTPLLAHLVATLAPTPRTRLKHWLQAGRVHVNAHVVTRHDHVLNPDDQIVIGPPPPPNRLGDVRILHQDAAVIVADKPPGLLTVATATETRQTLFARLSAHLTATQSGRIFTVHRLDRETSGLVLFARTPTARDQLQATWADVEKTYLAITRGQPREKMGVVSEALREGRDLRVRGVPPHAAGAQPARTHYQILQTAGPLALLEVRLKTGRKHQIRVHLAHLGCPILGDAVYGQPGPRLALHAHRLRFPHPATGASVSVESPPPTDFTRLMPTVTA